MWEQTRQNERSEYGKREISGHVAKKRVGLELSLVGWLRQINIVEIENKVGLVVWGLI